MKKIKICDTHNDFLTELPICEIAPYIKKCKEAEVEIICASYWSTRRQEEIIQKELKQRTKILRSGNEHYLLHIEDMWWVKDDKQLAFLKTIKPFSCSLTWNNENCLAGGTNSEAGLTKWGEMCLSEIIKENIVVDVAHLNRKSFWQVAKILKKNIYCSHTGFYGIRRHRRNLTDKQIDYIVESNGFVGLFFYDKCIQISTKNKPLQISDIVSNIKYFTSRWGFDNIGLGTDFYGIDNYPQGLSDYNQFENLYHVMEVAGFTENQINKIFYLNFKNFLSRVIK